VTENKAFTHDYFDSGKRYIGNAVQVHFRDGSSTRRVAVDYPIGHRARRQEGIPVLKKKFASSISARLRPGQWELLGNACADHDALCRMPVDDFMALLVA
jgi:2-methylcitrate dehydratase